MRFKEAFFLSESARHAKRRGRAAGFTMIEMVMVIMLIASLSLLSVTTITDSLNEARFSATVDKLNTIRDAMVGNVNIKQGDVRSNFGFLGDIGAIPSNAQDIASLVTNPGLPAYALDTTVRIGVGWNGPYVVTGGPGVDYTIDAWGNALDYDSTANPPRIKSLGADNAGGGTGYDQDITVTIPTTLREATVDGFLSNADGTPYIGDAEIEISYPDGTGVLDSTLVTIDAADKGYFTFSSIPLGIRSLSAYKPSKAAPTDTIANLIVVVDSGHVLVPASQLKW